MLSAPRRPGHRLPPRIAHAASSPANFLEKAKLTVRLLLESALALHGQFGGHLVGLSLPKMCCVVQVWCRRSKSAAGILLVGD
jgi:hypothetical protein